MILELLQALRWSDSTLAVRAETAMRVPKRYVWSKFKTCC